MTVPDDPVDPVDAGGDLPPADELDELASARLDGDDAADVGDPALEAEVARRQARFERVRAVLAEPVAVAHDDREAAIAAALAAATTTASGTDELAARRTDPTRRRGVGLKVIGAAAAVVAAVALGAAVLTAGGDDDDVDAAGEAPTEAEASLGGDDDSADAPLSGPSTDSEDAGGGQARVVLGDLGAFADVDALLDAVESGARGEVEVADGTHSTSGSNGYDVGCAPELLGGEIPEGLLATATLDGAPVAVFTVAGGDLVVVDIDSCTVVGRAP